MVVVVKATNVINGRHDGTNTIVTNRNNIMRMKLCFTDNKFTTFLIVDCEATKAVMFTKWTPTGQWYFRLDIKSAAVTS